MLPIVVFFYVLLILPFLGSPGQPRPENMLFWPALTALTLALALSNISKLDKGFFLSAPIASLIAYMIFAGASISWAYSPEFSFSRYSLHLLAVIIIFLPYALPISTTNTVQRLHMCCAIAMAVNAYYIMTIPPTPIGHAGYFTHKQELGLFCGTTIILATHELLFRGWRRIFGLAVIALTIWVILASQSKGPILFFVLAMSISPLVLIACKVLRTTPAYILGASALAFIVLNRLVPDLISRIGWRLNGDPTITGRTYIWQFMDSQISQRSWVGWGFQSYWGVPFSPHNQAPGFVRDMVSAHSGYLEVKLDTGYIGYWIFLVFVYTSMHYLEYVRRKDPVRAWVFLSLATYIILLNLTESMWVQTSSIWMLYLIMVGESVRLVRSEKTSVAVARQPAGSKYGSRLAMQTRALSR